MVSAMFAPQSPEETEARATRTVRDVGLDCASGDSAERQPSALEDSRKRLNWSCSG